MGDFKANAVKKIFAINVISELPGRLRLGIKNYKLIPPDVVLGTVKYIEKAILLLPGVTESPINTKIGTMLVKYDNTKLKTADILGWIDILIDTGVKYAPQVSKSGIKDPDKIEAFYTAKLQKLIPKKG